MSTMEELRAQLAAAKAEIATKNKLLATSKDGLSAVLAQLRLYTAVDSATSSFSKFASVKSGFLGQSLDSPSTSKGPIPTLFDISWGPPVASDLLPPLANDVLKAYSAVTPTAALIEQTNYPLATSFVPEWIDVLKERGPNDGSKAAHTLFLGCSSKEEPEHAKIVAGCNLKWECFPEMMTVPKSPLLPAFNAELKSAKSTADISDPRLYVELATYCTLGTLASLFRDVPEHHERLFTVPPVAYGLAGIGNMGFLVAFEWIGKMHMSVMSEPFLLGSPQHKKAVDALPAINFDPCKVEMNMTGVPIMVWGPKFDTTGRVPAIAAVMWTESPALDPAKQQRFLKFISGSYFWEFDDLKRLRKTYMAYERARLDAADPPPASLCEARLLYGAGHLCVDMPFIVGDDAQKHDLDEGGCAIKPLADAIAWLARHGLLYIDLRPNNVRKQKDGKVTLVDYDYIAVLTNRIMSFDAFYAELLKAPHVIANPSANYVAREGIWTPIGQALQAANWT